MVWQLVRLFASHDDPSLKTKVARLAKALVEYQPEIQNEVTAKKKALEQAVQGKLVVFYTITFYQLERYS